MTDKASVRGKQLETFLLSLDEQQFVKWVTVVERHLKIASGMAHGHRQERHLPILKSGDDIVWRVAALALAVAGCQGAISQSVPRFKTIL